MTNDKGPPCFDRLDAECFEARPEWAKQAFAYRLMRLLVPDELSKLLPQSLREPPELPGLTPDQAIALQARLRTPPVLPPGVAATGVAPPSYVAPTTSEPPTQAGKAAAPSCPPPALTERFNACSHTKFSTQDIDLPFTGDAGTWNIHLVGGNSGNNYVWTDPGYITQYAELLTRDNYVFIADDDTLNIRCSTEIEVRSKRTMGGGLKAEVQLWNGPPPSGSLLWSDNLTDSSSTTTQTFTHGQSLAGYSDLYLCLYVFDTRRQRTYHVKVLV